MAQSFQPNPELIEYLHRAFAAGQPDEQILQHVKQHGWNDFDIGLAWQAGKNLQVEASPSLEKPKVKKKGQAMSAPEMLLFIGGLIIIIAATTLIVANWSNLNAIGRIFTALIPNLILAGAGVGLWRNPQMRRAAHAFLVTGAIVMPFTLGIIFWQITEHADIEDTTRMFITSILSLAVYVGILWKYRALVWSTLSTLMSIVAYSTFLFVIHLDKIHHGNPFAWAYAIFGVLLFGVGMVLERSNWKFHARAPYAFGALSFVISLSVLALTGTLLGDGPHYDYYGSSGLTDLQRFETLLIGLVFLAAGWGSIQLRKHQFEEGSHFKALWDLVGAIAVCGAFLLVDVGDKGSLFYELLSMILSLSAAFVAVRLQNRQFFFAGTIVLAIGLIKIGIDHFSETLGWPVVLMIGGLAFMGAGFLLVRGQKQWFAKVEPQKPQAII